MGTDQEVEPFVQNWRLAMDDVTLSGLDLPARVQAIILLAALPSTWQPPTQSHLLPRQLHFLCMPIHALNSAHLTNHKDARIIQGHLHTDTNHPALIFI